MRPGHREDAVLAMPRDSLLRAGSDGRQRTQVIAVEAMVRHKNDRGVFAGELQQPREHHVVPAIDAGHDMLIKLEVALVDGGHARRMERHEMMAGDIDRFVIDRREIPRLVFENRCRDGVDRRRLWPSASRAGLTAIGLQIDLIDLRDHQREIGFYSVRQGAREDSRIDSRSCGGWTHPLGSGQPFSGWTSNDSANWLRRRRR